VHKPEHGQPSPTAQPGPARKCPGSTSYFGPTGQAWAEKSGPIDMMGRAWASDLRDLVKAQPDGPTARPFFGPTGQAWARKFGPTVGPGRAWAADS
jgi:hypothetical protein